jgi:hypothetical protein
MHFKIVQVEIEVSLPNYYYSYVVNLTLHICKSIIDGTFILEGLMKRAKRLTLADLVEKLGSKEWQRTSNKLQPWNKLLRLAFCTMADPQAALEASRDSWHTPAINGQWALTLQQDFFHKGPRG